MLAHCRLKIICTCLLALASCGDSSSQRADAGAQPDGAGVQADGGDIVGECGDLAEGEGECIQGPTLQVCEESNRVEYTCPAGTLCGSSQIEPSGVGCDCDNEADGVCPATACLGDIDCAANLAPCDFANATYTNLIAFASATEVNDSVTFGGDWAGDPNDFLNIRGLRPLSTGTTTVWGINETWMAWITLDNDKNLEPTAVLSILQGTLTLTSVDGNLSGTITDAVFVDDTTNPSCSSTMAALSFDVEIR